MSEASAPVAGWYPDPENSEAERWWNGSGWSDHRRTGGSAAISAPAWQPAAGPEGAAPVYYASTTPSNAMAIAGFAVSLGALVLGLIPGVVGAILSGIGLKAAKEREAAGIPNTGRGFALAGLIIGITLSALTLLFTVLYFGFFFWAFSSDLSGF